MVVMPVGSFVTGNPESEERKRENEGPQHKVIFAQPFAIGKYNVYEWVQDVWHRTYEGAPTDGSAWESGGDKERRVFRGGSRRFSPNRLPSAARGSTLPDGRFDGFGFRLARVTH